MILLIVASLANLFFQVPAVSLTISAIAVLIFSLYLLHDVSNIVRGGETNYVMATLSAVPEPVQHLHQPAEPAAGVLGAARLTRVAGSTAAVGAPCRSPRSFRKSQPRSRIARSALEQRDRLDVRGVREHVDHAGRRQRVAAVVDQHRRVARERGRVARDVDDAPRARRRRGSALTSAIAPSRGGSISTLSSGPSASRLSGVAANRLATRNVRRAGESVHGAHSRPRAGRARRCPRRRRRSRRGARSAA